MATPGPADRIRVAIAEAAEKMARQGVQPGGRDAPTPGELFVFEAGEDVGLEWLVVRFHPDDPNLLLLAPMDDFPLAGTPDLPLPHDLVGRPLTVRCGETDWFPAGFCSPRLRAGAIPERALSLVRQRLADLARGRTTATGDGSVDFDAEYEEWIREVARARAALLARAAVPDAKSLDVVPVASLSTSPPPRFAPTPEVSLAAETGGTLFAELGKALAEPGDVKYHEVPDVPGGKLFLVVDASGVRAVWDGPPASAPRFAGVSSSGDELPMPWRSGPEGRLSQTEQCLPWVDGRVVLVIGTVPPRTLAIQL
jgi:hypothetical protein